MIKPKESTVKVLNLLNVLDYLEFIGHVGIKDRIFDYLVENGGIHNDTYIDFFFNLDDLFYPNQDSEEKAVLETHLKDLEIIKTEFNLDDHIVFYISW